MKTVVVAILSLAWLASAQAEGKKIQDNSFLIEEAYNQEAGVVQHIFTYQYNEKTKLFTYGFTQEWPVHSQTHQLSFTLLLTHVGNTALGDSAINYRYQVPVKSDIIAVAPRFSVLLPTGDYKEGFGTGAVGYQINLPVSIEWNDVIVNHWNLGATIIPGSKAVTGETEDTVSMNYGMSIIYLMSENLNFMLEFAGQSVESPATGGNTTRQESFVISPGIRYAINLASGMQIVPGIAIPYGVGPSDMRDQYSSTPLLSTRSSSCKNFPLYKHGFVNPSKS